MSGKTGILSTDTRDQHQSYRVFGLTGGVASGKSTVAKVFSDKNFVVIDADQLTHLLSQPGGLGYEAIIRRFGTSDRGLLRKMVFSDSKARQDLEAILHPLIQAESLRLMSEAAKQAANPIIIYEAALLVEKNLASDFEGLIVVEAPKEIRLQRLLSRDGMSEEIAEKIFASQATDEERRKVATFTLDNSGSLEQLKKQVEELITKLEARNSLTDTHEDGI